TLTTLQDNRVLAVGSSVYSTSAEIYNAVAGTWSSTGNTVGGRFTHTATLLNNGKVLIAGGSNGSYLATCELFDPAGNAGVGSFANTGGLALSRQYHT